MLAPARRGLILSQSLRYVSSPINLPKSQFLRIRASRATPQSYIIPSRSFSIYPRLRQQAAVESEVQDAPPEFTEFSQLAEHGLVHQSVVDNITKMNIHTMTPVQRMTINECLDGADVIAQARTGTGKTLAFLMPIVQRLLRNPEDLDSLKTGRARASDIRALIISPTRELAEQIAVEARKLVDGTPVKVQTAVGGTQKDYHLNLMQRFGCHILVGTPGRVQDLLSDQNSGVRLDNIETFVLDEADRLLDIGFAPAIEEMQSFMPPRRESNRQTLMFSATVPKSVVALVRETLRPDFKFVRTVDPNEEATHVNIPQHMVFLPGLQNRVPAILEIATNAIEAHKKDPDNNSPFKAIVYFPSVNEVSLNTTWLENLRDPEVDRNRRSLFSPHPLAPCQIFQMSSKLDQRQRTRNSDMFRKAESAILISSDVTARGMDFPNVSHVIQVGLPKSADDYVHRVGRTGRAGKSGEGWLLMTQEDAREWKYKFERELRNVKENTSLHTGTLDMTRGAQIPSNIARLLQMVEESIKLVPFGLKGAAYTSILGTLSMGGIRDKQLLVDMVNDMAKYGWGMEKPPTVSQSYADKMGLGRTQGLEIGSARYDDDEGGRGGGRFGGRGGGPFGGRDGGRGGGRYNDRSGGGRRSDPMAELEGHSSGRDFGGRGGSGRGSGFGGFGSNRGGGDRDGGGGRRSRERDPFA